ncbi:hypothetical protein [Desulfosporosinus sp. BG]|uniref:hypothetical protein n=1 Tax=Desulfosporosinus sp. BG TaxID=1633135 RepID=UPI00083B2C50|nr:hypothetical protein [Desulfosporosinus sp. BG]ODA40731.1 hypothetical protein DSBG_2523 [Desulfosporosinus sp. BG]
MVRIYKVLIVGLVLLLLSGCTNLSWTTAGKIIPPLKTVCALEGKWTVIQDLKSSGNSSEGNQNWVGESAQFTQNAAMLGDYVWSNPTYKIKKVNSTDYLMTKYLNLSSTLVPESEEVDVITVSAAENFLGEFMKIDDSKIIGFIQNNALYLQKVSDQVDNSLATANPNEFNTNDQSKPGTSGVLVGLRVPSESDSNSGLENDFKYQTLWIAADNKKLHSVLTDNNIFFPRSSGFWELQVRNALNGTKIENELSAHDVTTKIPVKQERVMGINQKIVDKGTFIKTIDYVGNDYVAIENDSRDIKHLQVLPVDKISASSGIKLSDLLGTNGLTAYRSARARPLRVLSNEGISLVDEDKFEENFGLTRKNGHWYLQGRINYQNEGKLHYMDYNVNLIPPAKLTYYDTLCLSWQNIKDRIPDAMDAFTSPNRDIALVITKSKLYVYGISADLLDSEPLTKIDMNIGETVVMAEWATGSYVDNWEKAFLANGAKVMSYDNEK